MRLLRKYRWLLFSDTERKLIREGLLAYDDFPAGFGLKYARLNETHVVPSAAYHTPELHRALIRELADAS